jgi:hypothetical protein
MSTDKELMLSGQWYNPNADDLLNERTITRTRLQKHNLTIASDFAGRDTQIRQILGKAGANVRLEQPFWCEYGYNIEVGDNFYSDFGLTILDSANVKMFYLEKGEAVEVYATSMHYAPCKVQDSGFSCIVVLPKDTNTALDKKGDITLRAKNKWLIAHVENERLLSGGAAAGIYGENFELKVVD